MAITRVRISNFKSFKDQDVQLGKFNVLIGANASGKSNFIQVFRFLRDIATDGLDNAISMQGGTPYLRNLKIGASNNLSIELVSDEEVEPGVQFLWPIRVKVRKSVGIKVQESVYRFSLKFRIKGPGFEIAEDSLRQKGDFVRLTIQQQKLKEKEKLNEGGIAFSNVGGRIQVELNAPDSVGIRKEDITPLSWGEWRLPPKTLLLSSEWFPSPLGRVLSRMSIYDFDPKLPKKAVPITGKAELEGDGSNLALILKNVLASKERRRKFANLMKDLLPFVDDLDTEKFADKSLLFKLRETYFAKEYLPASLISDGTIDLTALIAALYFEKKHLTIIEEPERNIHPYLIFKVVQMMKEASQQKQIIISTHNPEVVKYADVNDLLLVSRDREGFSTICRPSEKEEVKTFLQNEIGIEDLYVQNLLGI